MASDPMAHVRALEEAIERRLFRAADQAALAMEGAAITAAPKSLGQLQGRIHGQAEQDGLVIRARLRCDSPYGQYVEGGTGPAVGHQRYMPPKGALRLWVQRTLRPSAVKGDEGRVIDAVESAVRWKIYMKGTQPHPFMRPAWDAQRRTWKRDVSAAVKGGIREVARGAR